MVKTGGVFQPTSNCQEFRRLKFMEGNVQSQKPHPVNIVVHNEDTGGKPIDLKGESTDTV